MNYRTLFAGLNQLNRKWTGLKLEPNWHEKAGDAVCAVLSFLTWHWLNKTPSGCTTQQGWSSFSWKASLLSHPYIHRLHLPLIEAPACVGEEQKPAVHSWHFGTANSQATNINVCLPVLWIITTGNGKRKWPWEANLHTWWSVMSREHQNELVE